MTNRTLRLLIASVLGAIAAAVLVTTAVASPNRPTSTRLTPAGVVQEVSGNCDEAEHAADPECAATAVTTEPTTPTSTPATPTTIVAPPTTASTPTTTVASGGVDISGPCDEAEHATDPRCTGATAGTSSSGSGSGDGSGHDAGDDDGGHGGDRDSGSDDSGPGSDDSGDSGNSGHGSDD